MSTSTTTATTGGGAWEAILDKASTAVTEYLAATTRDFDPAAPLSQHMLHLIDRGTLRDIVVERNYNELCARLGCRNKPRGLEQANSASGGTLCFDWEPSDSASSSSCSDADDAERDGKHHVGPRDTDVPAGEGSASSKGKGGRERAADAAASAASGDVGDAADAEEIVYEDDLYTAESFRLAQRQRALLNRMQRKKLRREQRAMRAAAAAGGPVTKQSALVGPGGAALAGPRVLRNGMLGASFPQRFCCAECEEMHESAILPCVSPFVTHDYPTVFSAVTNLFPNLRVAALQQLAGAETSAAGLVKAVVETPGRPGAGPQTTATSATDRADATLAPVQVGVSYESTAHLPRSRAGKVKSRAVANSSEGGVADASAPASSPVLLRQVLEQMQVLQHVWAHEVVPRFSESHLPCVAAPQGEEEATGGIATNARGALRTPGAARSTVSYAAPAPPPQPRAALRGSLLLFDFIMNASSATTRRVFRAHFTQHRAALLKHCAATPPAGGEGRGSQSLDDAPLFRRVSSSIIAALEARRAATADPDGHAGRGDRSEDDGDRSSSDDDDLHIDPALQQQRRELFVSHLFSDDVAAALSRLLLVDYGVLSNSAWSGVWFKDVPLPARAAPSPGAGSATVGTSLLRSLRFPLAVPAVLLQAPGSTPEVLGLAMVLLVAAGCCSDVVWRGCARAEVAFEEVGEAVGLTDDDIAAAVRLLVLG